MSKRVRQHPAAESESCQGRHRLLSPVLFTPLGTQAALVWLPTPVATEHVRAGWAATMLGLGVCSPTHTLGSGTVNKCVGPLQLSKLG